VAIRSLIHQLGVWLETRWINPAFGGWVLLLLTLFFFGAATNTLAGWLYVMSGLGLALLGLGAILPVRSLGDLRLLRQPIEPISAGDHLTIQLDLHNPTNQAKVLLQGWDGLPPILGAPAQVAVTVVPPRGTYHWVYDQPVSHRGVYRWQDVTLRSGAPFGLFWHRRGYQAPAAAIVYPQVLPLANCPLMDTLGRDLSFHTSGNHRSLTSTSGSTRSLRSYQWGDPLRLIHWRTSARYGELQVRELELFTGNQDIVIALDSALNWETEAFEQAVVVAASLYFYGQKQQFKVWFWSSGVGLLQGDRPVLEALAAIQIPESPTAMLPHLPLIWLTQNPQSCESLPAASRWVLWPESLGGTGRKALRVDNPGLLIQPDETLTTQLQQPLASNPHG